MNRSFTVFFFFWMLYERTKVINVFIHTPYNVITCLISISVHAGSNYPNRHMAIEMEVGIYLIWAVLYFETSCWIRGINLWFVNSILRAHWKKNQNSFNFCKVEQISFYFIRIQPRDVVYEPSPFSSSSFVLFWSERLNNFTSFNSMNFYRQFDLMIDFFTAHKCMVIEATNKTKA